MLAGELDVVEHRQQRLQHAGDPCVAGDVAVAVDAAAVVDVLRLQPAQVDEALLRERHGGGEPAVVRVRVTRLP